MPSVLNLFYSEPDPDRWFLFDRFPRRLLRRSLRGKPRIGGQKRLFLNLCAGLQKLGVPYRVNDYRYIRHHPDELACIVGKPHLLDALSWRNPILFGAAVHSHPLADPALLQRLAVRQVLVPGEWMRRMCEPYYGQSVLAWPVGIDTDKWKPPATGQKTIDFLLYDKVRWNHSQSETSLLQPIRHALRKNALSFCEIRYGSYDEEQFWKNLQCCKGMIFLCEHETQGIAYQQALACGVPILAWDSQGFWQDPEFFPHRVKYRPVSSVPYWDERCGLKFRDASDFSEQLAQFLENLRAGKFSPRDYILENLTLETCAQRYVDIVRHLLHS